MISDALDGTFSIPARSDRMPQSVTVPGLRLRLPSAGRWLLVLNASFSEDGSGNDDINNVALLADGVAVDRRLIGGRASEPAGQHTSNCALIVPFNATAASTDITVEINAGPGAGRITIIGDSSSVGGVARLYAIPVQEGP